MQDSGNPLSEDFTSKRKQNQDNTPHGIYKSQTHPQQHYENRKVQAVSSRRGKPKCFTSLQPTSQTRVAKECTETNAQANMIRKGLATCPCFLRFCCRLVSPNYLSGTHSRGPDIFRSTNIYKSHDIDTKTEAFRST